MHKYRVSIRRFPPKDPGWSICVNIQESIELLAYISVGVWTGCFILDLGVDMNHKIGAIIAITDKGVLGKGLELPWPKGAIKGDLSHFRQVTTDTVIISGGNTSRSLGGPLPNRINIVVSQTVEEVPGIKVYPSLALAIGFALTLDKPIWIIGGAQVLKQAMRLRVLDQIWVTRVHEDYEGDVILDWNEDYLESEGFLKTGINRSENGQSTIEHWGAIRG